MRCGLRTANQGGWVQVRCLLGAYRIEFEARIEPTNDHLPGGASPQASAANSYDILLQNMQQ